MIYTTLNRVREHHPCADGWRKLLTHLNKTQADDEPLALVVLVLVVLVDRAQTPGTKATANSFLEGVVVGLIGHAVLLIGAIQTITGLGQLVGLAAILGHIVHGDAVVPVFIKNSNDRQHDFVDFEFWFVLVNIPKRPFPLSA